MMEKTVSNVNVFVPAIGKMYKEYFNGTKNQV